MAHSNSDIAQESAADFLSKEIWELVEETKDNYGWNEMYIVKVSKRDAVQRIVRTHLAAFEYKPNVLARIRHAIGVVGSFCLYVQFKPKKIKHVWNLPFEKRGNVIIPDRRASSLIMDSVATLNKGNNCLHADNYASIGISS